PTSGNPPGTPPPPATATTIADAKPAGSQVGRGVAIAAGGPLGGAHADGGANMNVGGDVVVTSTTVSNAHTNAFASQFGSLANGLTVDEETERQIRRLETIAAIDDHILFPVFDPNPPLQAVFDAETAVNSANNTITIATPHQFDTGDAVVYHNNEDDTNVGDLIDGTTYFISVDPVNPPLVRLHHTRANPINSPRRPNAGDNHAGVAERPFDPAAAVDSAADTIDVGNLAGLATGDAVKYFNGGGKFAGDTANNIGGLVDGRRYFVNVDDTDLNAIKIKLFNSRADAMAGANAIDLDASVATGVVHRIVNVVDAYHERKETIDPVRGVDGNNSRLKLVTPNLVTGDSVIYSNNGDSQSIGGLKSGDQYFVRVVTDEKGAPIGMKLYHTFADANADKNAIDLKPVANPGFSHLLVPSYVINPATAIDSFADTLDL